MGRSRFVGLVLILGLFTSLSITARELVPTRTIDVAVPAIDLLNQHHEEVMLAELLNHPDPVLVQFIFTTCNTICPIMSASFAAAREQLEAVYQPFRMVSITVDPHHDTPAVLHEYSQRFDAGKEWHFLTGKPEAINEVLKGFDAAIPGKNKMFHLPYTYIRGSAHKPWLRIEEVVSAGELVVIYAQVIEEYLSTLQSNDRKDTALVKTGEMLYLQGTRQEGTALHATTLGDVALQGEKAACVQCHRYSGFGSSEGGVYVLPITAPMLFSDRTPDRSHLFNKLFREEQPERFNARMRALQTRSAYNNETLLRALKDGIDPDGRPLDPLMPRYQLINGDMDALKAYLEQLSDQKDPGVNETEINIATVISENIDPAQRDAMIDTISAFVEWNNIDVHGDLDHPDASPNFRAEFFDAYRLWKWHVWTLKGPPDTWQSQLQHHYRQQPVFVLLSGMVAGSWAPVADFAEAEHIPVLFPLTDLPDYTPGERYTLYLDRGLALEANLVADDLQLLAQAATGAATADSPNTRPHRTVFNLFHNVPAGNVPAQALSARLADSADWVVQNAPFTHSTQLGAVVDSVLAQAGTEDVIVFWPGSLTSRLIEKLVAQSPGAVSIYLPGSSLAYLPQWMPEALRDRLRFPYRYALPGTIHPRSFRVQAWMDSRTIPVTHRNIQFNAYYAATVLKTGLNHIVDQFYRDFFLETIEHEAQNSLNPGTYTHLSLGPGQRYASNTGAIVRLGESNSRGWQIIAVSN